MRTQNQRSQKLPVKEDDDEWMDIPDDIYLDLPFK